LKKKEQGGIKEVVSLLKDRKKLKQLLFGKDIEQLDSNVSTHGEALLYAAKDRVTALLFGSSKGNGDLDGKIEYTEDGKSIFKEAYPGAFKERFDKATCMLYEVDGKTFDPSLREFTNDNTGKTTRLFDGEIVSKESAPVRSSKRIKNIYLELMAAAERGEIIIQEYKKDDPAYVAEMEQHIRRTITTLQGPDGKFILDDQKSGKFRFCMKKFPGIMKQIMQEKEQQSGTVELGAE
jgi:hypothetical protein